MLAPLSLTRYAIHDALQRCLTGISTQSSRLDHRCDTNPITNILAQIMPNFEAILETSVDNLAKDPPEDAHENEFIDSSRLVYDGVREIRFVKSFVIVKVNLVIQICDFLGARYC